jgi:hypothetical protein
MTSAMTLSLQAIKRSEDDSRRMDWEMEALARHMEEKYGIKIERNITEEMNASEISTNHTIIEYTVSAAGEVKVDEDIS